MNAVPSLLATDGSLLTTLPFVVPAFAVVLGMVGLMARDRLRRARRKPGDRQQRPEA